MTGAQITNAAVVSQRAKRGKRPPHPLDAEFAAAGLDRYMLDDFPTQPWGARAWCEHVFGPPTAPLKKLLVWEPAANRGFLYRGLKDYFGQVVGSDIFDYGAGFPTFNFLDMHPSEMFLPAEKLPPFLPREPDWIITNPPFVRAQEFIDTALYVARIGVAMLCRTQIMETVGRYEAIYDPKLKVAWAFSQFVERLPMNEAKCERDMATQSAYGWLTIWKDARQAPDILSRRHIPPCRRRLEQVVDYVDWRRAA